MKMTESPNTAGVFEEWFSGWWKNEPNLVSRINAHEAFLAGWDARTPSELSDEQVERLRALAGEVFDADGDAHYPTVLNAFVRGFLAGVTPQQEVDKAELREQGEWHIKFLNDGSDNAEYLRGQLELLGYLLGEDVEGYVDAWPKDGAQ